MFIDLDGALCAYCDEPAQVRLDHAQRALLERLTMRLQGAVCVLSGRGRDDLDRVLDSCRVMRCSDHGRDGVVPLHDDAALELERIERTLRVLATAFEAAGVWVERKPASCALHYRRCPALASRLIPAVREATTDCTQLHLLEGRCVLDVVARGDRPGAALRRLMRHAPFAGRVPVALGDELVDEDAFVAAAALGGFGIGIGPRASVVARHRLPDSDACHAWLDRLAHSPHEVVHA